MRIEIAFFMLLALAAPVRGDAETLAYPSFEYCAAEAPSEGLCFLRASLGENLVALDGADADKAAYVLFSIVRGLALGGAREPALQALGDYWAWLRQRQPKPADGEAAKQYLDDLLAFALKLAELRRLDPGYDRLMADVVPEIEGLAVKPSRLSISQRKGLVTLYGSIGQSETARALIAALPYSERDHQESATEVEALEDRLVKALLRGGQAIPAALSGRLPSREIEAYARVAALRGDALQENLSKQTSGKDWKPFDLEASDILVLAARGERQGAAERLTALIDHFIGLDDHESCGVFFGYQNGILRTALALGERTAVRRLIAFVAQEVADPVVCTSVFRLDDTLELLVSAKDYENAIALIAGWGARWGEGIMFLYHPTYIPLLETLQVLKQEGFDTLGLARRFVRITDIAWFPADIDVALLLLADEASQLAPLAERALNESSGRWKETAIAAMAMIDAPEPQEQPEGEAARALGGAWMEIALGHGYLGQTAHLIDFSRRAATSLAVSGMEDKAYFWAAYAVLRRGLVPAAVEMVRARPETSLRRSIAALIGMTLSPGYYWPFVRGDLNEATDEFGTAIEVCLAEIGRNRALSPAVLERAPFCGALAE